MTDSRCTQVLIDPVNSVNKIATACPARQDLKGNLNGNLNDTDDVNIKSEDLVVQLCSEPQKGDLARKSESLENLNRSLCPLVHFKLMLVYV